VSLSFRSITLFGPYSTQLLSETVNTYLGRQSWMTVSAAATAGN